MNVASRPRTHVVIGTTEGPVAIQRITAEDSDVQSVICLNGTVQALPVSAAYHSFVRRGTGMIARDFGHDAFRIDVDGRIDQGVSWQLPVYIAHALFHRHELGDGNPKTGDRLIWATGEVDVDLSVRAVDGVSEKLSRSLAAIQAWRAAGVEVQILLPSLNLGDGAGQIEQLAGVSGVERMTEVLTPITQHDSLVLRLSKRLQPVRRHWKLAVSALALLVVLGLGAGWWLGNTPEAEEEGIELDDFSGRARPIRG